MEGGKYRGVGASAKAMVTQQCDESVMIGTRRRRRPARLTPTQWVDRLLAHKGRGPAGIARRQRSGIPAYMTTEILREELRKRNHTLIISGDNYIALSHDRPIAIYR